MQRRIIVLLSIAALFLLSIPTSFAQGFEATITADKLNVRQTPGFNTPVAGELNSGTVVSVLGREDVDGNGGVWFRVSGGGVTGWVLSDYLAYSFDFNSLPIIPPSNFADGAGAPPPAADGGQPAAPAPAGGLGAVMTSDANLRGGAGTNFPRVGGITADTRVTLTGRNADGSWVRGNFNGTDAWVSSSLVRADGAIAGLPQTDGAPVAAEAAPAAADAPASAPVTSAPLPAPVSSGGPIGGFAYGAHIGGFGGTELMSAIGMTWVKVQIRYNRGDGPGGALGVVNEGHGRGFRVLLGVVGDPNQLAADPDGYISDFAGFLAGLAAGGTDAIEVWNEPNLDREWPQGQVDPGFYTRMLAAAYNSIKRSNPGTLVISGAPAPTGFFGGCSAQGCDDSVYLQGMAAAGAGNYMDCVGAHYNEGIVPPTQNSGDPRSEYYTRYLPGMISVYYNAFRKPVCFTELGYLTPAGYGGLPPGFEWAGNVSLQQQASWLADAIAISARDSRVRMVIVWNFNYRTDPSAPDPAGGYAMIRPDGTCPACDAIRARR